VPIAVTAEQHAIQASILRWARDAGTIAAARAREGRPSDHGRIPRPSGGAEAPGHAGTAYERDIWRGLAGFGLFALGLPEEVGGTGTMTDLAVALEQVTVALVPGPVMPTVLAGLALATHTDAPAVKDLLPALVTGDVSVAVAWGSGPVLGAGETSHLLLPHGPRYVLLDAGDVRVRPLRPLDFSRAIGVVALSDVDPDGAVPLTRQAVRDMAALLASVEAAAVADWCVRTATAYAKVRRQFDRPIGAFQAVKHLCATMLCRSERATAAAWDASVAYGQSPKEFPLAAAVAASVALEAAVDNAKDCIQVLGGIGFTWEHDAHLFLRRAVALRQLLGGAATWRRRVARLAAAGERRSPRVAIADPTIPNDLRSQVAETVRAAVREIAALPAALQRAALADAGYLTPAWPRPYGLGASAAEQFAFDEELAAHGIVRPDLQVAAWALPAIIGHGTDAQRERFVGPSLRGEIVWCQLFSEPEAGSDLASLRTRAVRVDGGWLLTGQKVWTSLAHQADWAICLARTDPEAPKHQGLGYFLVAMDSPGLEIRSLREITGEALFNEVFLDDVFVPDRDVVGLPGDGWRLARATLENERVAIGRGSALGEELERVVAAADTANDPAALDRVGTLVADGLAVSTMELRATLRRLAGEPVGAESAVRKLVGVAHRQAVAEAALALCGEQGAAVDDTTAAAVHDFLSSRCLSIAGGTTQILLNVVAERVLGLPREEVR
jgi:alkylation response protein AidB-like acyl-CoA dehydrogenase